jgi:hypothetical protein
MGLKSTLLHQRRSSRTASAWRRLPEWRRSRGCSTAASGTEPSACAHISREQSVLGRMRQAFRSSSGLMMRGQGGLPMQAGGPALLFSCTPQQSQRRKRVYSREAAPPRPCSRPAVHGVRSRVFDAFSQLFDRAACAALRTCGPLLRPTYSLILEQCALCSGQCPCGRSGQRPLGTGRLGARGASPGHDIKVPWLEQCMLGGWFSYRVRHEDRL